MRVETSMELDAADSVMDAYAQPAASDADFAGLEHSPHSRKLMTGWLEKKGSSWTTWKKRYFVWRPGMSQIEYYKSENFSSETLIKQFAVAKVFDIPSRGRMGVREFRIDLFNTDLTQVLSLNAFSRADKHMWLDEFYKTVEAPALSMHPRFSDLSS